MKIGVAVIATTVKTVVVVVAIRVEASRTPLISRTAKEKASANGSVAGGAIVVERTDGRAQPSDNPFTAKKSTACTLF